MTISRHQDSLLEADIVIIGGGLAGLTCAIALLDVGLRIVIIEREEILGGRARSWVDRETGDPVDIGPHIFLTEYPNTLKLLDILETRDQLIWHTDQFVTMVKGQRRIVMRMAPLPPPFHFVPSVFADTTVSHIDKLSNLSVTWLAMQMDERDVLQLDQTNAYDFLRSNGVSDRYIEHFWAFVSMSIMNVPVERCSAGALMRFYRHLIGHNNYHIGFPNQGLANIFTARAGKMLDDHGVKFLMQTAVKEFTGDADSLTGVLTDKLRIEARYFIAAIPPQDLSAIVRREWLEHYSVFRDLASFIPCPYISNYIWFDRKLTRQQFWARLVSPGYLNCDFYDLSNINRGWQNRPSVIASNIIYNHRAQDLPDEEIIKATIREISEFLPATASAKVTRSVVNRIPMAIHCPYPGTERKRPETKTPIRNLFLAGDWTRTGVPSSMESAVRSGWLAAECVLAELGKPRKLAIQIKETEGLAGFVRRMTQWFRRFENYSAS